MNEFLESVLEEIVADLPEVDESDVQGILIRDAHARRRAGEELGTSRRKIDSALMYLLTDVERSGSYRYDGTETESLEDWCSSVEGLKQIMEDPHERDYFKRIINAIVSLAVPIEMMNIPNPRAVDEDGALVQRNITAEDIIESGPRMMKEIATHFAHAATDEDREDIALALVKGEGKDKLAELRKKKDDANPKPIMYIRQNADGSIDLFGHFAGDLLLLVENRLKGVMEFEYEQGQGTGEDDPD